jgi:hypothetical protein
VLGSAIPLDLFWVAVGAGAGPRFGRFLAAPSRISTKPGSHRAGEVPASELSSVRNRTRGVASSCKVGSVCPATLAGEQRVFPRAPNASRSRSQLVDRTI